MDKQYWCATKKRNQLIGNRVRVPSSAAAVKPENLPILDRARRVLCLSVPLQAIGGQTLYGALDGHSGLWPEWLFVFLLAGMYSKGILLGD